MSNKKYSKEFKLKLIKEHEDNGVSFYAIGLILLIGACGSGGAFFYLNPWSSSTKRIWFRNTIFRSFDPTVHIVIFGGQQGNDIRPTCDIIYGHIWSKILCRERLLT